MTWLKRLLEYLAVPIALIAKSFFEVKAREKRVEDLEKRLEEFDAASRHDNPGVISGHLNDLLRDSKED